jgi:hypothetical protein
LTANGRADVAGGGGGVLGVFVREETAPAETSVCTPGSDRGTAIDGVVVSGVVSGRLVTGDGRPERGAGAAVTEAALDEGVAAGLVAAIRRVRCTNVAAPTNAMASAMLMAVMVPVRRRTGSAVTGASEPRAALSRLSVGLKAKLSGAWLLA